MGSSKERLRGRLRSIALPCDRCKDEKRATGGAEQQAHNPKPAFPCKGGNCSDGNRDLEHRHAACEHFVLVKI
jgi:hypothetical protein